MTPGASDLTVTDMFCGAGGSSQGAAEAGASIRLALNHWKLAVQTHNTNFPHADHDCADVSATDPRRYYPTDVLIASPECTNHSLAKGQRRKRLGQFNFFEPGKIDPAAERSRATMWDVVRFAECHRYRLVIVENVVDARFWECWDAWLLAMHNLGYAHECVYLNSMFCHPTPQSRDRMYVVFWRRGNRRPDLAITPPAWCPRCETDVEAVQAWKPGRSWGRYKRQYVYACPRCATEAVPYYYAALNAIDWSLPAERIGDRDRPLKPRTLERIRYGLGKYGRTALLVQPTLKAPADRRGRGRFVDASRVRDAAGEPCFTQTGSAHTALVSPAVVMTFRNYEGVGYPVRSIRAPLNTQVTNSQDRLILPPSFTTPAGSLEGPPRGLAEPVGTLTTSDRFALVSHGALMAMRDAGRFVWGGPDAPAHTQMASASQSAIVSRAPFLVSYYGNDQSAHAAAAVPTVTAIDRHALVEPAPTMMGTDKHAVVEPGFDDLDVEDCYFRMFAAHEVLRAMAFRPGYVVLGTSREQVKQGGNAVTPPAMRELMARGIASLTGERAA